MLGYDIENSVMRDLFTKKMTQEFVTTNFTSDLVDAGVVSKDTKITYTDFKTSDINTNLGNALKIEFNMGYDNITRSETIYYYFFDRYCITLYTDDIEDNITPDAKLLGNI